MKEITFTVIILAILFTFGFCSTRASEIEPVRWAEPTIDWASFKDAVPLCHCAGIEIPVMQKSVFYCNGFESTRYLYCEFNKKKEVTR